MLPTGPQYKKWTMPSKASFWGLPVGIIGGLIGVISLGVYLYDRTTARPNYPRVLIEPTAKPNLRYEQKPDGNFEFSFELRFKNVSSVASAIDFKYANILQVLEVDGKEITSS